MVKARRIKANTITIRVNDVIITRRLGKIARPAKMITSLTGVDQSLPSASFVVALSITVIRSLMLGTVFADFFTEELSSAWPKDKSAGAKTTKTKKNVLISLPAIYILNYYLFPSPINPFPTRNQLRQPAS